MAHERLLSGAVLLWLCCHRNASWRRPAGRTFNLASRIEEKILREIGDQIALRSLDLSSSAPTTETREIERFSVRGRTAGGTDTFGSIIAIIGRILTQPRKNQFPVCTRVFSITNKNPSFSSSSSSGTARAETAGKLHTQNSTHKLQIYSRPTPTKKNQRRAFSYLHLSAVRVSPAPPKQTLAENGR